MMERGVEGTSVSLPRAVVGSLLLNSLYDPEGQQRGGTVYLLRSLVPGDTPGRAAALDEISEQPVNTNPMLAGLALGPLLSLVHDSATSREAARALKDAKAQGHKLVVLVGDEPFYAKTGFKRAHIYSLMKVGKFPKAMRLGVRAVGWDSVEIDQWIADRLKERT